MSLKGVEMQIALPRTAEATHTQQHLNQKPAFDQAAAALQHIKQAERQRQSSNEVTPSEFLHVREDGKGHSDSGGNRERKKAAARSAGASRPGEMSHPYKGKHIDITL